jgi:hypothetical protein
LSASWEEELIPWKVLTNSGSPVTENGPNSGANGTDDIEAMYRRTRLIVGAIKVDLIK